MRGQRHYFSNQPVNFGIVRIKFMIITGGKHFKPGVHQEDAKNIKYPVKPGHQRNTNRDEQDAKNDGHQDANQESPGDIFFLNIEGRKNEDEYENIVNAQAPLHQVSTQVFERQGLAIFNPHEDEKPQRQGHPKKSLVQSLANGDDFVFLTQQTQIKGECQDEEDTKNKVGDLVSGHVS